MTVGFHVMFEYMLAFFFLLRISLYVLHCILWCCLLLAPLPFLHYDWDIGRRLYPPDNSCVISAVSCIVLSKSCDPLGQVLAAQGPAHSFRRWPELLLSASVVLALFWVSRHSVLVLLCVDCSKLILLEQDCLEGGAM